MPSPPELVVFLLAYIAVLGGVALLNRREFDRSPEKKHRYRSLPVGYKLTCWFLVAPQCAAVTIWPWFTVSGMVSYALLEAACVRWYRKAGLLPA